MSDCCLLFHWTSLGESGPKGADGDPGPQGRQLAHETYPFTTIDPVNDYCLCPPGPQGSQGSQGPPGPTGPIGEMVNYDPFSIYVLQLSVLFCMAFIGSMYCLQSVVAKML